MTVVKFVKRFLHLYPPWINGRCCYRSSSTVRKDSQTHTTEEKNARRVTQMKWQATNKQFYGPVVKETDDKKKRASSLFKFKDSTKKLLPVGLWSDLAVQKYGRKIQIVNAIRSSSSDADKPLPIKARDDPSPSTLLSDSSNDADRPLIKVPEASRSQSAALINDSTPDKPLTVMPAPSQPSSTVLRSSSHEPCPTVLEPQVATSPELPGLPFYQKNNVILPFPMVPGTKKVLLEDGGTGTEISSLPSPEEKYPSVTTILKETMTKDNEAVLDAWRKRKIAEVGEDGFREFMRGTINIHLRRLPRTGAIGSWNYFYMVLPSLKSTQTPFMSGGSCTSASKHVCEVMLWTSVVLHHPRGRSLYNPSFASFQEWITTLCTSSLASPGIGSV